VKPPRRRRALAGWATGWAAVTAGVGWRVGPWLGLIVGGLVLAVTCLLLVDVEGDDR
jgi:hypothetical protein